MKGKDNNNGLFFYLLASLTLIAYASRVGEIFPLLGTIRINLILFSLSLLFFFFAGIYRTIDWQAKELKLFFFLQLLGYISIPFSAWPRNTLINCNSILLINFFSFFLCLNIITTKQSVHNFVKSLIIVCLLLLIGLTIRPQYWNDRISTTNSYDPNDLALIFSFVTPLAISFFVNTKWLGKIITIFILTSMVTAIISTGSRGGLIAFGIAAFFILLSKNMNMKLWLKAFFLIAVISFLLSPMAENIRTRFVELSTGEDYNLQMDVAGGRLAVWRSSLAILIKNPIIGVGVGNSSVALGNEFRTWKVTHNSYLQMALEFGIPGFCIFLSMLWYTYKNCTYVLQTINNRGDPSNSLLISYSSSLRIALISYMCAAFFLTQALSITVPIMLALSLQLKNITNETIEHERQTNSETEDTSSH